MNFAEHWNWAHWTWVVLAFLALVAGASNHGKPREPHNAFLTFINFGVMLGLLIAGGFFPA